MYSGKLPSMQDIVYLSTRIKTYPATRSEILRTARMWGAKSHTIAFLREFPPEFTFATRSGFVHQCELRAQHIRNQWESPRRTTQLSLI